MGGWRIKGWLPLLFSFGILVYQKKNGWFLILVFGLSKKKDFATFTINNYILLTRE